MSLYLDCSHIFIWTVVIFYKINGSLYACHCQVYHKSLGRITIHHIPLFFSKSTREIEISIFNLQILFKVLLDLLALYEYTIPHFPHCYSKNSFAGNICLKFAAIQPFEYGSRHTYDCVRRSDLKFDEYLECNMRPQSVLKM